MFKSILILLAMGALSQVASASVCETECGITYSSRSGVLHILEIPDAHANRTDNMQKCAALGGRYEDGITTRGYGAPVCLEYTSIAAKSVGTNEKASALACRRALPPIASVIQAGGYYYWPSEVNVWTSCK